jgi:3-methylcrotonyl-CoA carboxylase alpha subunit
MASVTRIGRGVYRVEHDGRQDIVYVAGGGSDRWAFWNGRIFRIRHDDRSPQARTAGARVAQALTAPMPATILKVLVTPGASVKKGDTLVVAEAMKMELPIRALGDGVVTAVLCREGELVQADQQLVEMA